MSAEGSLRPIDRIWRWASPFLVMAVMVTPIALLVRACFAPEIHQLARVVSPDKKWVAAEKITEYPGFLAVGDEWETFVSLRRTRRWDWFDKEHKVVAFWAAASTDRVLGLRWVDERTLEVTLSAEIKYIERQEQNFEDVTIRYNTVPPAR